MSLNFNQPVSDDVLDRLKSMFGEPVASDRKTFLYPSMPEINSRQMTEIANAAKQPVTVALHSTGDIKTMTDGTRYEVTATGWKKL
jgi:hypothetical protein